MVPRARHFFKVNNRYLLKNYNKSKSSFFSYEAQHIRSTYVRFLVLFVNGKCLNRGTILTYAESKTAMSLCCVGNNSLNQVSKMTNKTFSSFEVKKGNFKNIFDISPVVSHFSYKKFLCIKCVRKTTFGSSVWLYDNKGERVHRKRSPRYCWLCVTGFVESPICLLE